MSAPPFNLAAVDQATRLSMEAGHRMLQTHRFDSDDAVQADFLLVMMEPPEGARILDAGCGVGEVSRLMAQSDPSLRFDLVNVSEYQLSHCPVSPAFTKRLADCHALPVPDDSYDVVMFNSALCQMDIEVALSEAERVLKPGGILFISDMARTAGDPDEMEVVLAARVLPANSLARMIIAAGFDITSMVSPGGDDAHFREMLKTAGAEHLLNGIIPIIFRALKKG